MPNGNLLRIAPLLLTAFLLLPAATTTRAEIFGLVIGVDDYTGTANDLSGAVNDAADISRALRHVGASNVVALVNDRADRDSIERSWSAFLGIVQKSDTIVFSFSGLGGIEAGDGDARGRRVFYLGGYTPRGAATRERIRESELVAWLNAALTIGVRVVVIVDTGYATRLNRDGAAAGLRYRAARFAPPQGAGDQLEPVTNTDLESLADRAPLFLFEAAARDRGAPEILIGDKWRGALSWAVARALEGRADADGDRRISAGELNTFLARAVPLITEFQQSPKSATPSPQDHELFILAEGETAGEAPVPEASRQAGAPAALRLYVDGTPPPHLAGRDDVNLVNSARNADLIWSPATGDVTHPVGGRVAEAIDHRAIGAVIAKWAALSAVRMAALDTPLDIFAAGGHRRYRPGDMVRIHMPASGRPAVTLIGLSPTGRVDLLIPADRREAETDWSRTAIIERYRIDGAPHGAEHRILIASPSPPEKLRRKVKEMAATGATAGLAGLLDELRAGPGVAIGVTAIYSGE